MALGSCWKFRNFRPGKSEESPSHFSRAVAAGSPTCLAEFIVFVCFCAIRKYGSVRTRVCFTEDDFGESGPQKQKKPKDTSPERVLGIVVLTPIS